MLDNIQLRYGLNQFGFDVKARGVIKGLASYNRSTRVDWLRFEISWNSLFEIRIAVANLKRLREES